MSSVEHDEWVRKAWRAFWFLRLGLSAVLVVAMVVFWADQQKLVQVLAVMSAWALFTSDLPSGRGET